MRKTAGFWQISLPFAAWITLWLYFDKSGGAVYSLSAALFHECGHLFALLLCGEKPRRLLVSFFGMRLERTEQTALSYEREALLYAAGPAANLILCLPFAGLSVRFPFLLRGVQANAILCLFNLLPLRPMDGGQVLYALLCRRTTPQRASELCKKTAACGAVPLAALSLYACIRHGWNYSLVLSSLYVLFVVVLP